MACSTCLITAGIEPNCENKVGGGAQKKIWMIPKCKIASYAQGVDNVIDSFTLVTPLTDVFYEVVVRKDSVSVTEDLTLPNGFITQTLAFTIDNLSSNANLDVAAQEALDFAQSIVNSNENIVAIVEERAGVKRVLGLQRGLEPGTAQRTTGLVLTDQAGNAITLVAAENTYAPVLDSTYVIPV